MATTISQNSSPRSNGMSPSAVDEKRFRGPRLVKHFQGCSRISEYEMLNKLGEGTFGEVHRARSRKNNEIVALKKILMHNEKDGFPITALREIKLLKLLSHINVLKLEEMAVEHAVKGNDKRKRAIMYMVTPYMDHDLSGLLENPNVTFTVPQIKCYMLQLLEGTRYLHDNRILHRDMKAANLLINNKGILQIADFGLARHYDEAVPKAGCGGGEARRDYTVLVVTRWYRPPELLLLLRKYTSAIDLWGVGCVFGEMLIGKPILAGDSDVRQLEIIFELMGSPTEETMPGWRSLPGAEGVTPRARQPTLADRFKEHGPMAISLLNELLKLDWRKRYNAIDALKHPYFRTEPLPARPGDLPSFEESHELDRRKFRSQKAAPPPAPKGGTVGMGTTGEWGGEPGTGHGGFSNGESYGGMENRYHNSSRYPSNAPPVAYRSGGPVPDRKPAWHRDPRDVRDQRDQREPRPDTRLPPRPEYRVPYGGYDGARSDRHDTYRDRDREPALPRNRVPAGPSDVYIPSYRQESGRRIDQRRRDDRDDREDHRYDRRERLDYDERRRDRSRSRSPARERDGHARERDPLDRDREVYRR